MSKASASRLQSRLCSFWVSALGSARCGSRAARRVPLVSPAKFLRAMLLTALSLPPSYDGEKSRRYPVLYFLHGLGDNDADFLHSGGWNLIQDLWEQKHIGEFLIVTPERRIEASTSILSTARVATRIFSFEEFIPSIERRYRIEAGRATRGIGGFSMGGYGALRLAFLHPELFGSVSVHSAALMEKLPNVTVAGSVETPRMKLLGDVFGSPPDRAFWDRNNPLALARTAPIARLKIYFDCGADDGYGFDAGARTLDKILTSRGIRHEFHIYPGGHDWPYFAEHLPASLEFESRAFGVIPVAK